MGQGGCERRIEVFVKIQKKKMGWGRGRVWGVRVDVIEELKSFWENSQTKYSGGGSVWEGQGGCERRIEVFVQIQKKLGGGGSGWWGWGVRVDENEELKFL